MPKKKSKKPKYNQTSQILSAIKRTFSRSPATYELLNENRQELVQYNKDGSKSKKQAVRFPCSSCKKLFMRTEIQIDHCNPVIPLNIPAKHCSWDLIIDRLFCNKSNLNILCLDCHSAKSKEENTIRREWKTKEKFIVYKIKYQVYAIHHTFNYDDGHIKRGQIIDVFETKKEAKNYLDQLEE